MLSLSPGLVAALACLTAAPPPTATPKNPFVGVWRAKESVLVFEERRVLIGGFDPNDAALVADYGVTADGIVFGVFTRDRLTAELGPVMTRPLTDETFRFRAHVDGDELTIKDVKFPAIRVQGRVPTPAGELREDPRQAVGQVMLQMERAVAGTYTRTTREALEKREKARPNPTPPAAPRPAPRYDETGYPPSPPALK